MDPRSRKYLFADLFLYIWILLCSYTNILKPLTLIIPTNDSNSSFPFLSLVLFLHVCVCVCEVRSPPPRNSDDRFVYSSCMRLHTHTHTHSQAQTDSISDLIRFTSVILNARQFKSAQRNIFANQSACILLLLWWCSFFIANRILTIYWMDCKFSLSMPHESQILTKSVLI